MYAVIQTGGQQLKVQAGDKIKIQKLKDDIGSKIEFNDILLVSDGTGETVKIGAPYVKGAKVKATVLSHGRGPKVMIQKFRRRKHYDKLQGHRQDFTEIEVTDVKG